MASESDILVRTKDCKPVYDGDLAYVVSGDTETSKTWADKSKEYADEAAASAADAAASAEATAGSVEAAAGYAESAEASAQAAAQSAEGIQEALEAAEAARDTAVASGNAAQTAASAASQSAQSAMSDAQGAAASATGAALSAQQAAGSASSAAQAAARAAGSATNAGMSKTAAEAARDLAMVYARQAQEAGSGSSEDAEKARQAATEAALSAVSAAASAEEVNGAVATVTEARDEAVAASGAAVAAKNAAVTAKNAAAASAAAADEDRALALAYAQSAERSKNSAAADSLAARGYRDGAEQARDRAVLEAAAAGVQKDLAKRWATSMTVVEDGLYGARKYAVDASEASGEAGEAVQAAQEAQRLAEQARDAAVGSATTAAGKASEASDSAVAAAGSASAAAVTKGQVDALHDATLDVYEATANTYDSVVEVYGWAAKASADAQGHANDALVARRGAEAAQDAAETAEESAEAWASKGDHTPVEGELYSSKEYAERAAASAAEIQAVAELVQDAAIQGRNNTFTETNTFNGDVIVGHGPEGVKARCYFGSVNATALKLAGTLSDGIHPPLELPADQNRTRDSLINEINTYGAYMEIVASANGATYINLEAAQPGAAQNSIVYTRTGCFSTAADGRAQTTNQGSNIAGSDTGQATEYKLLENGYPVASRQTNNVYKGVQSFNNAVALNGNTYFGSGGSLQVDPETGFAVGDALTKDFRWFYNFWLNFEILKASQSSSIINFHFLEKILSKVNTVYITKLDLDFDFPRGSSFEGKSITIAPVTANAASMRLHLGDFVSGSLPFMGSSNAAWEKMTLDLPKAASFSIPVYGVFARHIVINTPSLTTCPAGFSLNWNAIGQIIEGDLGLVTSLASVFSQNSSLYLWKCHARHLADINLNPAKLNLESVQFIADDLKDWTGDAAEHTANIGVSAAIRDTEAVALAAAKAELEAKGWTVTFTYN